MRACLATGLPLWMEIILFVLRWGGVAGELLPQGAAGVSTQVFSVERNCCEAESGFLSSLLLANIFAPTSVVVGL